MTSCASKPFLSQGTNIGGEIFAMQNIGRLFLKMMVFVGQWMLFHWLLDLTGLPQIDLAANLFSIILVSLAALFSMILVFRNR